MPGLPLGRRHAGAVWSCRKWASGGDGCPNAPVLGGTACDTPGQLCAYGDVLRPLGRRELQVRGRVLAEGPLRARDVRPPGLSPLRGPGANVAKLAAECGA